MRGWRRRIVVGVCCLGLAPAAAGVVRALPSGAAADTTPLALRALSFTPGSVDTSGGPATVVVEARLTDDASGPSSGGRLPLSRVDLVGPGGSQRASAYLSVAQRVAGTPLDGTYRATVVLPWHAEPGRWAATAVLVDAAGNTATMGSAALAAAGFGSGVTQSGPGDTQPPALMSLTVAPPAVDTALAAATITVTARVSDDRSGISVGHGVAASQVVLRGPTGAHRVRATLDVARRVGGDSLDATYSVPVVVPRWSEQGAWTVEHAVLVDAVGNVAVVGVPGIGFTQTGVGDVLAPRVAAFSLTPGGVDVRTAPAVVTMRTRLTDDRSGVADGVTDSATEVVFRSPGGGQELVGRFGLAQRTAGSAIDGWYEARVTVPTTAEAGEWRLVTARPVDQAHNAATLDAAAWLAAGYAGVLTVASNVVPAPSTTTTSPAPDASSTTVPFDPSTSTTPTSGSTTTAVPTSTTPDSTTPDSTTPDSTTPDSTTPDSTTPDSASTTTPPSSTIPGATIPGPTTTIRASGTTVAGAAQPPRTTPAAPRADGYWFTSQSGTVLGYGGGASTAGAAAASFAPTVGMAATPTGRGWWTVRADGTVHAAGDARFQGSMAGRPLAHPIVGMAATPTGRGYWLVARDGGIFSFGDAAFFGSTGALTLNQPIVGMAASPTGRGYWFVAADGGIFAFGDARFHGSTGALTLNQPVVGMAASPSGRGYWLVARDGGIFSFGDAAFFGSTGSLRLTRPIVGMATSPTGRGYWFVAADGGIFAFGDARFFGALGGYPLPSPIVAMAVHTSRTP